VNKQDRDESTLIDIEEDIECSEIGITAGETLDNSISTISNIQWKRTFDAIRDAVCIIGSDMRIRRCNRAMADLVGLPESEIVGTLCHRAIHGREESLENCPLCRMWRSGEKETLTLETDGTWLEISVYPIPDGEGNVLEAVHIVSDVTEQKTAEMALRESEEKYRLVSENVPVTVYSALPDDNSTNLYISGGIERLTGYKPKEFLDDSGLWNRILHPEDRDRVWQAVLDHRTSKTALDVRYRIVSKEGLVRWVQDRAVPKLDEKGYIIRIDGYMEDVTDRKRAEDALREREEQLEAIFDGAKDGIAFLDMSGKILKINKYIMDIGGFSDEDLVGKRFSALKIFSQRSLARMVSAFERLKKENTVPPYIIEARTKKGEKLILEISNLLLLKHGRPSGVVAILRDITERKHAEEALRISEDKYRSVVEAANEAIVVAQDGLLKFANLKAVEITGYSEEELLTMPFPELIHPDDRSMVIDRHMRRLKGEDLDSVYTFRIVDKRGREKWVEISAVLIDWDEGPATLNLLSDITERLEAEKALRESEDRYRNIVEMAPEGILIMDLKGTIVSSNPAFQRMTGLNREEIEGRHFTKLPTVRIREAPKYLKLFKAILKDEAPGLFETKWMTRDGESRFCQTHASLMKRDGRPWGIQIIVADITERKFAEKVEKVLHRIARASNEIEDMEGFLWTVHHELGNLIDTTNFYVALYHEESDAYSFSYHVDEHDTVKTSEPEKLPKSLTDYVRRTGEPLLANQQVHSMLMERGTVEIVGTPSPIWMGVPLKTPNGVIGVMAVQSYTNPVLYSIKDLELLTLVAGTVSMAIERKRTAEDLQESNVRLQTTITGTIEAMVRTVEVRDPYTAGHQKRVAELALAIARRMNLPQDQMEAVYMAASIHDIGKVNVPAEILSKPGDLTDTEIRLIKVHPKIGYDILKNIEFPWPIAELVLQHHERFDGSGYPQGLEGEEILLGARILGVSDVVEAMSAHRPHRSALGIEKAVEEIKRFRGSRYDPRVVDACVEVIKDKGSEAW
jgi:PAS domain S-box-containing protein